MLLNEWKKSNAIEPQVLPAYEILENGYKILMEKWEILLSEVDLWRKLRSSESPDLSHARLKEGGHPLARPIAIIAFVEAASQLLESDSEASLLGKVSSHFSDITKAPFKGLLWKESGGMYDGQARRKAASTIFKYYISGSPEIGEVVSRWESATGQKCPYSFTDRDAIIG